MSSFFTPPVPPPAVPTAPSPPPPLIPDFVYDVYSVSPYGDFALMNRMYFATAPTAFGLAMRYGALPLLQIGSPECPISARWAVVEIHPDSTLLPPSGMRQADPQKIMNAMELTPFKQWVLKWPSGFITNAGRLADYYYRIPEAQFPGLADHYVRLLLAGDGVQL